MKKIYLWGLAVLSVIGLSTGVVKALNYSEISNQPSVLGESAYTTQILTSVNNASIKISVTPQSYDSATGFWSYKVAWSRVKNLAGSIYINNQATNSNVSQKGEEIVKVLPGVKNKLEFYSKPNKKGILLVRKYFTSMVATASEPVACTMEARLCPDGVNYVSRTGPNCEFAACPTTTKPICPKGLIYMPSCSGVPVQNPDTCEITCTTENTCKNLWWHDNSNTTCSQRQFCGSYMYQTLKTFETEAACKADIINPNPSPVISCQQLWWYDNNSTACAQKQFCGDQNYYVLNGIKTFFTEADCKIDFITSPKILTVSPNSAYATQTVNITGSGFLPTGNKIFARGGANNIDLGEYPSSDGKTITFSVPVNPADGLVYGRSISPGAYKIGVKNIKGESNLLDFTVIKKFYGICDYAAPPAGCSYAPGPNYDAQSQCGMILTCSNTDSCDRTTDKVMPYCTNGTPVFNVTKCQYECPLNQ